MSEKQNRGTACRLVIGRSEHAPVWLRWFTEKGFARFQMVDSIDDGMIKTRRSGAVIARHADCARLPRLLHE